MARLVYIDVYSQELWSLPTRSPILRWYFQRGSAELIKVRFVKDGVPTMLYDTDDQLTLSFKLAPNATSFLIPPVQSAINPGDSHSFDGDHVPYYYLQPSFSSSVLDLALGNSNSVEAYGEFKWPDTGNVALHAPVTSNVSGFVCRIFANLNRGGEAIPGVVSSTQPSILNGIVNFTGSTAGTDLPTVPSLGIPKGTGIPYFIRLNGQFVPVYLDAGAPDGTDPGQVAPLDDANSHWTRGL